MVADPGQRQAEAEVRVVVGRARLDDGAEVVRRGRVPAGVELGAGERLADAARGRLGIAARCRTCAAAAGLPLPSSSMPVVYQACTSAGSGRRRRGHPPPPLPRFARCYRSRPAWPAKFSGTGNPSYRLVLLTWCADPLSVRRWFRPGLVLAPFRGVRYDPDRVSGLANVTSPPYDVIGPGTLDQLLAAYAVQHRPADL